MRSLLFFWPPLTLPQKGRPQQWLFFILVHFNSLIKPLQPKTNSEAKAFPVGEGWMGLLNLKANLSLAVAKASVIIYNFKKPFFKIVILTLLTCFISSCKSVTIAGNKLEGVQFCDLPKHVGDTVFVRAFYSGFEEYWSLSNKGCQELRVELAFPDYNNITSEVDSAFNKVHESYFNIVLDIEMIGVFQNQEKQYGHLGSNNGQFSVIKFHKIRQKRIK